MTTVSDFPTWLSNEAERRGWTLNELARRSGLSSAGISMLSTGQRNPGFDACVAIARALGHPPEKVLRVAGLLPDTDPDSEPIKEILEILNQLLPGRRDQVLSFARFMYREQLEDEI